MKLGKGVNESSFWNVSLHFVLPGCETDCSEPSALVCGLLGNCITFIAIFVHGRL